MKLQKKDTAPMNTYGVSQKQWKKWTVVARHVFNKTYGRMIDNQDLYSHPATVMNGNLSLQEYKVLAWNASFEAACVCSRGEKILIEQLQEEIKG